MTCTAGYATRGSPLWPAARVRLTVSCGSCISVVVCACDCCTSVCFKTAHSSWRVLWGSLSLCSF